MADSGMRRRAPVVSLCLTAFPPFLPPRSFPPASSHALPHHPSSSSSCNTTQSAGAWGQDTDKPKTSMASAKVRTQTSSLLYLFYYFPPPSLPPLTPPLPILQVLERMDVFTKFHDEDKVQTSRGATMALLSWFLVLVLFCSESYEFLVRRRNGRGRRREGGEGLWSYNLVSQSRRYSCLFFLPYVATT